MLLFSSILKESIPQNSSDCPPPFREYLGSLAWTPAAPLWLFFLSPSYSFLALWYRLPHWCFSSETVFIKIPYSSATHSIMALKFWSKAGLPKVSLRKSWWIARPPSHPFPQSSLQIQTSTQCYAPSGYMLITVTQNTYIVCWKCKLKKKTALSWFLFSGPSYFPVQEKASEVHGTASRNKAFLSSLIFTLWLG